MYAARKEAAEKLPGKNTWKPLVRQRIGRMERAVIVVYGWP